MQKERIDISFVIEVEMSDDKNIDDIITFAEDQLINFDSDIAIKSASYSGHTEAIS